MSRPTTVSSRPSSIHNVDVDVNVDSAEQPTYDDLESMIKSIGSARNSAGSLNLLRKSNSARAISAVNLSQNLEYDNPEIKDEDEINTPANDNGNAKSLFVNTKDDSNDSSLSAEDDVKSYTTATPISGRPLSAILANKMTTFKVSSPTNPSTLSNNINYNEDYSISTEDTQSQKDSFSFFNKLDETNEIENDDSINNNSKIHETDINSSLISDDKQTDDLDRPILDLVDDKEYSNYEDDSGNTQNENDSIVSTKEQGNVFENEHILELLNDKEYDDYAEDSINDDSPTNVNEFSLNDEQYIDKIPINGKLFDIPVKKEMLSLEDLVLNTEPHTPENPSKSDELNGELNDDDDDDDIIVKNYDSINMDTTTNEFISNTEKNDVSSSNLNIDNIEQDSLVEKPTIPSRKSSILSSTSTNSILPPLDTNELDFSFKLPRRRTLAQQMSAPAILDRRTRSDSFSETKSISLQNSSFVNSVSTRNSPLNSGASSSPYHNNSNNLYLLNKTQTESPRSSVPQLSMKRSASDQPNKSNVFSNPVRNSSTSTNNSSDDTPTRKISIWGSYFANSFQAVKESLSKVQQKELDSPAIFDPAEDINWEFWGKVVNNFEDTKNNCPSEFKKNIYHGIPDQLRSMVWQLLSKSKNLEMENVYSTLMKRTSVHEKVIQRDLARTFPNHDHFMEANGAGQESLFNIIKAYSLYDQQVGYCQGTAFIVGALLLNMPDEEAFSVLVSLMKTYNLRDLYAPSMIGLQIKLYQYDQLLQEYFPTTWKHLNDEEINSSMYVSQWFLTMFAYKLPLPAVMRILDIVLYEGIDAMLNFALSLIKRNQEHIEKLDFESLLEFLKNGLFDIYNGKIDLLILDAASFRVSKTKINKFAQDFITEFKNKDNPEGLELKQLHGENRRLTENIKKMEHEFEILNKEHVDLANKYMETASVNDKLRDQCKSLEDQLSEFTKNELGLQQKAENRVKEEMDKLAQKNVELIAKNAKLIEINDDNNLNLINLRKKLEDSEAANMALVQKYEEVLISIRNNE